MPAHDPSRRWESSLIALATLALLALTGSPALAQTAPQVAPKKPPRTMAIDVSAFLGGLVRLGDAPAFNVTERAGPMAGGSVSYYFHPVAIGLSYEHASLGREESGIGPLGVVRMTRALDTAWLFARMRVSGLEPLVPFIQAGPGAVWQNVRADGVALLGGGIRGGQPFRCSANDAPNLGLRVGWGAEVPLSPSVLFIGEGSFDAYRLSSETIDNCAPGAGTASALMLRLGFVYRFDLTGGGASAAR